MRTTTTEARKEARKESHKSWKVEKFSRAQVEDINEFIGKFPSAVFVSKSPELWKCSRPQNIKDRRTTDVEYVEVQEQTSV